MDNLTHTLTGFVLARTGLSDSTRGATLTLLLASNLPDVDLVTALAGPASYLHHHRDLTHSIVGVPVLALGLAYVVWLALRGARFLVLLACALAGVVAHVFMDLWTSYGTRVLSPFDHTWYSWDLVFIVDPLILFMLLAALLVPRGRPASPRLAALGLGLVLSYVGARAVLHARALDEAVARVPGGGVVRAAALPYPLEPMRWRILADTGAAYWTGEVRLGRPVAPLRRRDKRPEDPLVARVRESSAVASIFLDFSRFPWLEVEETPDGTMVTWRDLRFERTGQERFVTRVMVAPDGHIRSEAFRF